MDDLDERVASLALREDEEQRRLALLAAAHQQHQQHHQQQHQQQAYQQAGDTLAFGDHTLRKHRSQRFTVPTYTSQSYAPPPFAPPSLPLSSGFSQPPLGFGEPSVDLTQRTLHTARSTTGLSSAFAAGSQPEDEVIPTAIVIKNIPFHVPRDVLLNVMDGLHLPQPFAFNYHYDSNQFRGLAFANFRRPEHAQLCVSALHGYELHGRKLRAEFKRVLKEGEKEQIERNKALRRIRSQRDLQPAMPPPPPPPLPPITTAMLQRREASAPGWMGVSPSLGGVSDHESPEDDSDPDVPASAVFRTQAHEVDEDDDDEEDYGRVIHDSASESRASSSDVGTSVSARVAMSEAPSSKSSGRVDMNDPQTLEIYTRVAVFRDDVLRDELAFARALTRVQRDVVRACARRLGLATTTRGQAATKHVVVLKQSALSAPRGPRKAPSHASLAPMANGATLLQKRSVPDMRGSRRSLLSAPAPPLPTSMPRYQAPGSSSSPVSAQAASMLAGGVLFPHSPGEEHRPTFFTPEPPSPANINGVIGEHHARTHSRSGSSLTSAAPGAGRPMHAHTQSSSSITFPQL